MTSRMWTQHGMQCTLSRDPETGNLKRVSKGPRDQTQSQCFPHSHLWSNHTATKSSALWTTWNPQFKLKYTSRWAYIVNQLTHLLSFQKIYISLTLDCLICGLRNLGHTVWPCLTVLVTKSRILSWLKTQRSDHMKWSSQDPHLPLLIWQSCRSDLHDTYLSMDKLHRSALCGQSQHCLELPAQSYCNHQALDTQTPSCCLPFMTQCMCMLQHSQLTNHSSSARRWTASFFKQARHIWSCSLPHLFFCCHLFMTPCMWESRKSCFGLT